LANQGRTVLVSSHLLSEMSLTATDLIVIGKGQLITQATTTDFIQQAGGSVTRVRSPQLDALRDALTAAGATVAANGVQGNDGRPALVVSNMAIGAIGELAASIGAVLHELSPQSGSLEEAFLRMTGESVEFRSPAEEIDSAPR
ncbi:MAG TPA: ABC transporter ATP-binding protein, partial [Pseudonocardiaceae bacterium]|nr:ABC transporter ATP-binding protein [Pseudonocardiaceae bacterium]